MRTIKTHKHSIGKYERKKRIKEDKEFNDNEKAFKQYRQNNIPNEVAVERTEDERASGASEESEGSVRTQP